MPEEDQATLWDLIDEFEAPPYLKKLKHEFRHNCLLDAYGLFLAIHSLFSYATELYCLKNLNCHLADLPIPSECEPDYFEKLRENIEQEQDME